MKAPIICETITSEAPPPPPIGHKSASLARAQVPQLQQRSLNSCNNTQLRATHGTRLSVRVELRRAVTAATQKCVFAIDW